MNNSNVDYVTLHYRSVLNDFSNQFLNEEFSDCVLNAEGKSLKVHRAMLCAQSSLLEKIVLEHRSIGDLCFIIEGVSFEDLKSVVQFMYNGSTNLTKKKVGSFLVVAELLGVKWLDRIQLLNDTEASKIDMNVANENEPSISNTVRDNTTETQSTSVTKSLACSVFKNLTNVLDSAIIKRKKHMKGEKHCKKSRCAKEDHKHEKKKHKMRHPFSHTSNTVETKEKVPGKETHLADMDENTFCTTLGLKKNNEVQPRELSSKSGPASVNTDTKIVAKSRSVPPLIKINREVKSNVESFESRDSNVIVSEINTLYIEDKNLSFLNIGANELCIRDNNIEIECDVLDASSSQFVIEKEETASIVELRDGNIIRAEFVDINPEDSSSYSDSTRESTKKPARPSRKKSVGKKSLTIDKSYFEGSTLFWCDVCQRTYHTKTGLNQHKRYECCKEPAFACPRCEKRFKRKSSLVRHAITLHDEAIFPTRTKLLSKLTSQDDRSILTISGKR